MYLVYRNELKKNMCDFPLFSLFDTFVISPHSRKIHQKHTYIFLFKLCKFVRCTQPELIHERRLSKTKQTKTYLTLNHPVSDPVQRKRKRAKKLKQNRRNYIWKIICYCLSQLLSLLLLLSLLQSPVSTIILLII